MYKYVRIINDVWLRAYILLLCVQCCIEVECHGVLRVVYNIGDGWGLCAAMGILPKLLVYCFIDVVVLFHAKFVHMYILFSGKEYVVLFEAFQKFSFF
jgi:hypothetical protein